MAIQHRDRPSSQEGAGLSVSRVAIFGGTFDPVHDAHISVANEAARAMALDRVLLIPAGRPPHKNNLGRTPYEHRYRMVELACQGEPRLEPSRLEEGDRKSFTIDTIERIGTGRLFLIIGADAFADIHTWYRLPDVLARVEFIVLSRPGHVYAVPEGARIRRLDTLELHTSSTAIREALARGERPAGLADAVWDYIKANRLYRTPEPPPETR